MVLLIHLLTFYTESVNKGSMCPPPFQYYLLQPATPDVTVSGLQGAEGGFRLGRRKNGGCPIGCGRGSFGGDGRPCRRAVTSFLVTLSSLRSLSLPAAGRSRRTNGRAFCS